MLLDKTTGERLLEHEKQQEDETEVVKRRQEGDAEASDQVAGDADAETS